MALYWCVGGERDGEGRLAEDRGETDESVLYKEDSWKYGRGYYAPVTPIQYVETSRGRALVMSYIGSRKPGAF